MRIGMIVTGFAGYPNDVGMQMARQALASLKRKGIDVVFAGEAILTPAQGRKAARSLLCEDVCGVVFFHGTWTPPYITMGALLELEHLPLASWGFGLYEDAGRRESTGSIVAVTVLRGTLDKMGKKCAYVLGLPDDEQAVNKIKVFCEAATARRLLRDCRLGLVGYSAMGIYPGMFDHALMRCRVGPEVVHIDTYSLIRRAEAASEKDKSEVVARLKGMAKIDKSVQPEWLDKAAGLYLGAKELIREHELTAMDIKCQFELSHEYGCIACIPSSMLADEGEIVSCCEGDVPRTVAMAMFQYFTGEPANFGDVLEIEGNEVVISSCGYALFSQAHPEDEKIICDIAYPGFTGALCSWTSPEGPITYARLIETGDGKYKLYMGTGTGLRTERRQGRMPSLRVRLNARDMDVYWEHLTSHHYAYAYGNHIDRLKELCRLLDIEPVVID